MAAIKGEGKTIKTQLDADNATVGQYHVTDGLSLKVVERNGTISGSYVYRMQQNGMRTDVSIGSRKKVKLQDAKNKAKRAELAILAGECPKEAIGRGKSTKGTREGSTGPKDYSLRAVVNRVFEVLKPSLKGGGVNGRWMSPLEVHVLPVLGARHVESITADDVVKLLRPIWQTKQTTAQKCYNRLNIALNYAADEGAKVDEAAMLRAKRLLGKQAPRKPKHHTAIPFNDIPAVYAALTDMDQTPQVLATRFLILTAHRHEPVRLAKHDEIDLSERLWLVPAENLKGKLGATDDFETPLSAEALRVVGIAQAQRQSERLFHGKGIGDCINVNAVRGVLKLVVADATAHGVRSTFIDWSRENEVFAHTANKAIQHGGGQGKAIDAYDRTDMLEPRRKLMEDWGTFVTSERVNTLSGNLRAVK